MSTVQKNGAHFCFNVMLMRLNKKSPGNPGDFCYFVKRNYLFLIAACAAASLAIGTRKGEQET